MTRSFVVLFERCYLLLQPLTLNPKKNPASSSVFCSIFCPWEAEGRHVPIVAIGGVASSASPSIPRAVYASPGLRSLQKLSVSTSEASGEPRGGCKVCCGLRPARRGWRGSGQPCQSWCCSSFRRVLGTSRFGMVSRRSALLYITLTGGSLVFGMSLKACSKNRML